MYKKFLFYFCSIFIICCNRNKTEYYFFAPLIENSKLLVYETEDKVQQKLGHLHPSYIFKKGFDIYAKEFYINLDSTEIETTLFFYFKENKLIGISANYIFNSDSLINNKIITSIKNYYQINDSLNMSQPYKFEYNQLLKLQLLNSKKTKIEGIENKDSIWVTICINDYFDQIAQ